MSRLPRTSLARGVSFVAVLLLVCGPAGAQTDVSERDMNAEQMLEPLDQAKTSSVKVEKLSKPATAKKVETVTKVSQKANTGSSEMTLVGRGGAVAVVGKNGQVEEVKQGSLVMKNRAKSLGRVTLPAASENGEGAKEKGTAEGQGAAKGEGAAKGQGAVEGKNGAADAKETKSKPEDEKAKAEAEAVKKADIEKLRSVQRMNGWFYTSDGKPISSEELNKRIEKGDVAGITFMDQFQQKQTTKSKPKQESENAQAGHSSGVGATSDATSMDVTTTEGTSR